MHYFYPNYLRKLSNNKSNFQFLENIREQRNKADNDKKKQANPEYRKSGPDHPKSHCHGEKWEGRAKILTNKKHPKCNQNF